MRVPPSIPNHLRQARRNGSVARGYTGQGNPWELRQWAVIAAFYAAVHLAKALALRMAAHRIRQETRHDFYSRVIRTHASLRASVSYERLRIASTATRYDLEMPPSRTVAKLVNTDLARLDTEVRQLCR